MFTIALSDDEIVYEVNSQCLGSANEEEKAYAPDLGFAISTLSHLQSPQDMSAVEAGEEKRPGFISQSLTMLTDFLFPDSQE